VRTLRTFTRRPAALLALGAALVASVAACGCGIGFALVPLVGGALLRTALDAARDAHAPLHPAPDAQSRTLAVARWFALPTLAAAGACGLVAALSEALGASLVARVTSPAPTLAALVALVVAASLSTPLADLACDASTRDSAAPPARDRKRLGAHAALTCAILALLLTAPAAAFFSAGFLRLEAIVGIALVAACGVALAFCDLATAWTIHAPSATFEVPPADDADTARDTRPRAFASYTLVAAGCAVVIAALFTPARLTHASDGDAPLAGPLRTFVARTTIPGTTVRLGVDGEALHVSVADGGGAGRIGGVDAARGYRFSPRPSVCPTCVELEVLGAGRAARTILDAAGVRHDDDDAARLASAGGLPGNLALLLAVAASLALAHTASRRRGRHLAVMTLWLAALVAFAHGLLA